VRAAFRDLVHNASRSTVRILGGGVQVALGVVVRSDGLILSKASELDEHIECCLADGRRLEGQVLAVDAPTDLALIKVEAKDLVVVEWSDADLPTVGSLLATTGLDNAPAAIGVVSSPVHAVPQPRPVLGVGLENSAKGPRIDRIVPRSPAAKAGLQVGDVVLRIEEQSLSDREGLIAAIETREPGQQIELSVLREQRTLSITAVLGDLSHIGNPEQAELMDSLGGPLSKRRFGFPAVVQHDTVLRPRDCGGPIVGLDGKTVGINIARASRVASYALPASSVRPVLEKLMQQETQVAHEGQDLAPVSIKP
jgi:serine protease Do